MASLAPSAASPSATAFPSHLLEAATTATRSLRPRSMPSKLPLEDVLPHGFPFPRARIDWLEMSRALQRNQLGIVRRLGEPLAHIERNHVVGGPVDHTLWHGYRQKLHRRRYGVPRRDLFLRSPQELRHNPIA